jgi:hypothetical protein
MERMAWTDERLDDAVARIDRNFDRVWEEFREVRVEFRGLRTEMSTSQRQLTSIGWALVGVLVAQLTAIVLAFA